MKEHSLFGNSLFAHLVSLLLVTAIVVASVFFSLRRSVTIWNVNRGQRLENLILPILADVYRREGTLVSEKLHDQLRPILSANVYAYVFDPEGTPVYLYSLGRRTPLYDQEAVEKQLRRLSDANRSLTPVVDGYQIVGYLSADTLGFTHDAANRRLLLTISNTVISGSIAAVIVAFGAAWLFSSRTARQAHDVTAGLQRISTGERDVSFPATATTELREISDSAVKLQNQLLRDEQLRKRWMEDIAHDLRTPIAALKSQIEGMVEGYLSIGRDRIKRLFEEVEHVEWLVAGLRELSHIESPDTEIHYEQVDPCMLVESVIAGIVPESEKISQKVQVSCDTDSKIRANPHLLRRAVENLVANATQHVEPKGQVFVIIGENDTKESCVIDIANSGHVDPSEIPRFFDRLYSDKSGSRTSSGLGLPIAKSIVERHGGTIEMLQRGSCTHVIMRLPIVELPAQ